MKKDVRKSSTAKKSLQSLEQKCQELERACADVISRNGGLRDESKALQRQMASLEDAVERLSKNQDEQNLAHFADLKDMQKQLNEIKVLAQKTHTE